MRIEAEDKAARQKTEMQSMKTIISQALSEHEHTRKLLSSVTVERDTLGTQMVRRCDEIGLLYEKIKIL